jgi:hypothetical protein
MLRALSIPLSLLLPALWTVPTSDPSIAGRATYYSPGLMEQVAANRGITLAGYAGGVALNRARDLRRAVWIEWAGGPITGPYLVVDCAARGTDYELRERLHLILEVDAQTAQARGFFDVGPVPVTVWFTNPRPADQQDAN